jgi:hypothetical protein
MAKCGHLLFEVVLFFEQFSKGFSPFWISEASVLAVPGYSKVKNPWKNAI